MNVIIVRQGIIFNKALKIASGISAMLPTVNNAEEIIYVEFVILDIV